MRLSLFIMAASFLFISCKKEDTASGNLVEIYLLKNYQMSTGKCSVDAASLLDSAVVLNNDIIAYSVSEYKFTLNFAAIQKLKTLTDFTPFAVTVDKQVIYYGIFKPAFSSSSCGESVTMDIDWNAGNKITLNLGYPGTIQGITIDDQRNNPKLIATLKNQGKLQ